MGGSLTEEEIHEITARYPEYDCKMFVETGTYKGETSRLASRFFKTVHTIEIVPKLFQEAKMASFQEGITNIVHHYGDSVKILEDIPVESTVYFLDAHQSGWDTSNNGKNVPLFDELAVILRKNPGKKIIIIDDVRLFSRYQDWAGISVQSIIKFFGANTPVDSLVKNDRMIIWC